MPVDTRGFRPIHGFGDYLQQSFDAGIESVEVEGDRVNIPIVSTMVCIPNALDSFCYVTDLDQPLADAARGGQVIFALGFRGSTNERRAPGGQLPRGVVRDGGHGGSITDAW